MKTTILTALLALLFALICGCGKTSNSDRIIRALFAPGLAEDSYVKYTTGIRRYPTNQKTIITEDEWASIVDCFENRRSKTNLTPSSPQLLFVVDASRYFILGDNDILEHSNHECYELNDSEVYILKKAAGYYNYIEKEDVESFPEIKKFGIPRNYNYIIFDRSKPVPHRVLTIIESE